MFSEPHAAFDAAVRAFLSLPGPEALLDLSEAAIALCKAPPQKPWRHVRSRTGFDEPFREIRLVCDRGLSPEEVERLSGCLGYALQENLAGDELPLPRVEVATVGCRPAYTTLFFAWDSGSSSRPAPDFAAAFQVARQYAFEGTPLRTTERRGAGTKGTRLVEGISPCSLALYVR